MSRHRLSSSDHVRRVVRSLAVLVGLNALTAFSETVYVPVVSANVHQTSALHPDVFWISTLTLSNPTDTPLTFRHVRIFGGAGASIDTGCLNTSLTVPPHDLWRFSDIAGGTCADPGGGPAFLELDLDSGLIVTTGISLTEFRYCYSNAPAPQPVSLAAAPLPVYRALVPADTVAVSSDIALPTQPPIGHECRIETDPVSGRVNVTILNAGPVAATATVQAAGSPLAPYVLTLPAGTTIQLNNVFPGATYHRALLVSVTQPFLAYASSVVSWADPDQVPAIAVVEFRRLP